jgi:hypothetical protein
MSNSTRVLPEKFNSLLLRQSEAEYYARLFVEKYPQWAARCNGRLARAIRIATKAGATLAGDVPGIFLVQSDHNPRGWYTVDMNAKTCTCPDDGQNKDGPKIICKHRLSVALRMYGPDWTHEHIEKRMRAQSAAHQAALAAWDDANDAATIYENLRPETYDDPATEAARQRMLELTTRAEQLQAQYTALIAQGF